MIVTFEVLAIGGETWSVRQEMPNLWPHGAERGFKLLDAWSDARLNR